MLHSDACLFFSVGLFIARDAGVDKRVWTLRALVELHRVPVTAKKRDLVGLRRKTFQVWRERERETDRQTDR